MAFTPGGGVSGGNDQQKDDARKVLTSFLEQYGLKGLDGFVNQAVTESWSPERVELELRKTDTFRQSFPEIVEREKRGLPAVSPADVLNYRREVKTYMFNAGLPAGFYDEPSDYVDLMAVKDLSAAEIKSRVEQGFARVAAAPASVKEAFNSFFGASGEGALAAFFLDPQRGEAALQKAVASAEVGGFGKQFGFNIDLTRAEQLAAQGRNAQQTWEQVNQMKSLTEETFGETQDLTNDTIIGAGFGESGQAQDDIQKRLQERSAQFKGGGGAVQGQKGLGLGSAE